MGGKKVTKKLNLLGSILGIVNIPVEMVLLVKNLSQLQAPTELAKPQLAGEFKIVH
jgi:hypothetical protein